MRGGTAIALLRRLLPAVLVGAHDAAAAHFAHRHLAGAVDGLVVVAREGPLVGHDDAVDLRLEVLQRIAHARAVRGAGLADGGGYPSLWRLLRRH